MKFTCQHCGFEAKILSGHNIDFCPNCGKNSQGKPKKSGWDKFKDFTDWMMTPQTIYWSESFTAEGAEEMRAVAEVKRAQADLERARKGTPKEVTHQHIHLTSKQLRARQIEADDDHKEDEDDY